MQLVTRLGARRLRTSVGLVVLGAITLSGCVNTNAWSRSKIDLVASFTKDVDADWPYLNAHDTTALTCGPVTNCVQAVSSDYVTILKFDSAADAATYASTLGTSGAQIDPLVVHFNGKATSNRVREEIIGAVSGINSDSAD